MRNGCAFRPQTERATQLAGSGTWHVPGSTSPSIPRSRYSRSGLRQFTVAVVAFSGQAHAIACHPGVERFPKGHRAWDVQDQCQRPQEHQSPREIPHSLRATPCFSGWIDDVHLGQKVFPSDVGKVVGHARIVERSSNKVAAQIEPSQEGNLTAAKPALPVVEHRGGGSCGVARMCVVVSHQWANGRRLTGSFWDRDSIFQQFDG